jgi:hypothetical protein
VTLAKPLERYESLELAGEPRFKDHIVLRGAPGGCATSTGARWRKLGDCRFDGRRVHPLFCGATCTANELGAVVSAGLMA